MKIIGKRDNGFIVDIDANELAKLIGYHSSYEGNFYSKVPIGAEIQIHEMFSQLYDMARAQVRLLEAAKTLRAVADLTEMVIPIIAEPVKP